MSARIPTTEIVANIYEIGDGDEANYRRRTERRKAFFAWLSAHDAEVRASVLVEQGEPEWEYGLTWSPHVTGDGASPVSYTGCETPEGARETGRQLAGSAQTPQVWRRPMRPAFQAVPAGPWEPVQENGEAT